MNNKTKVHSKQAMVIGGLGKLRKAKEQIPDLTLRENDAQNMKTERAYSQLETTRKSKYTYDNRDGRAKPDSSSDEENDAYNDSFSYELKGDISKVHQELQQKQFKYFATLNRNMVDQIQTMVANNEA